MGDPLEITTNPSSRLLSIPTSRPADFESDVFVSLDDTVEKLGALLNDASKRGEHVTFIRAPVAAGKTTLAKYLTTQHKEDYVEVDFAFSEDMWYQHIIDASGQEDLQLYAVKKALLAIGKQGKTIVIDEAHLLFSYPNVVALLTKGLHGKKETPRILLFSASGSAVGKNRTSVATPIEITNKYVWYPPVPNSQQLVEDLKEATHPIHLTEESVKFFISLCGGHRGIFMQAMSWVQACQNNPQPPHGDIKIWDIQDSVFHVRKTFEDGRKAGPPGLRWNTGLRLQLQQSRAVKVNGDYSSLENIPKEFAMVLFGGPKSAVELNGLERELTINGFVFPERQNKDDEFVPYEWTNFAVRYSVSNPVMAEYYNDVLTSFKRRLVEEKRMPSSAADLIARVLPYMTFTSVVDNPIVREGGLQTPLSKDGLPYEDDYNDAIAEILRTTLNYTVSRPKSPCFGKADILVTYDDERKCAIESIMSSQTMKSQVEHAQRFLNPSKSNYTEAHHKALLVIGPEKDQVISRVNGVADAMKDKEGVPEIVGVVVSLTHDTYQMYLPGKGPLFFVCDRVAKTLEIDEYGRFASAQECALVNSPPKRLKSN